MGSWGALESVDGRTEDAEEYTRRKRELTKKIVMLKIQVLCLKQVHVSSCIRQLQDLAISGNKTLTPITLQFHKFEDWVQVNQQDFCVREDKESSQSSVTTRQSFTSHLELKLGSKEPDVASRELNLEEVVVSEGSIEIASIFGQDFRHKLYKQ
ncbi:hypothetical protein OS493_015182 [Desmophyllum pertusum]|uniref:Uncharacterized protein n=1 Tax=Desmophyllum pertusum TaxID=174260 RepID=A0A9W9ZRH3_9CNID|nr:hypothetical protein OS493_015182 [Desmophyllum pertusum]